MYAHLNPESAKACALKVDCGFLLHSHGDTGYFGPVGIGERYEISGPLVATFPPYLFLHEYNIYYNILDLSILYSIII